MMLDLPEKIKALVGSESYSIDPIGMSDSTVLLFADKIVKIQPIHEGAENEHHIMEWLQGRISVPRILGYEEQNGKSFLLMTKLPGKISCADEYMRDPEKLVSMLADGLQALWKVDIAQCPYNCSLEKKLLMAEYNVAHNLVNLDHVEPETFGENGFQNPKRLLEWLYANRPDEDMVLSHGDYCLPNIFGTEEKLSGLIDLGRTGIADKWQDIALCYRSLLHNFKGKYAGTSYEGFQEDLLFKKLRIEPDWDKIRYYILLDELF